ncbi:MAG: NAD-dependent epimerase/dehydratase family protein, partial [Bacteroidota bacterium]
RKLAHVSSVAAIGRGRDGELLTENTKWEPFSNNYALSKHYAEREVWRAAEEGLDTVIVNPCLVLGPGAWGKSSTNVFRAVWKGLKFYTEGSGAFVDVRDVSRTTIRLMDSAIVNERFLVVAENLPYRDLFNQLADGLGKPRARVKASRTMLALAWRLERVKSLFGGNTIGVTRETAQSAVAKTRYSNQKITETLDYAFRPVDQSIKEICALFLEDVQSSGT